MAARKRTKLKQIDLARELHLSQEAVSRYEAGKSLPNAENIALLAKLLDVSSDYLLGLSDQEQSPKPLREQLSPQEWELLYQFRRLSPRVKERTLGYIDGAVQNQPKTKKP